MRCLIVGGTGFLGKNLVRGLLKENHEVVVYARDYNKLHEVKCYFEKVEVICGDFSKETDFESALNGVDCVFFLISATGPANKNLELDFAQNVMPSFALFDCCARKGIKLVFFSSGGTVYGEPQYLPIDEMHPTNPICAYGMSKMILERTLEYYRVMYGLDYLVLRISNPYGLGQEPARRQGVIAVFLAHVLTEKEIEIWGNGETVRDYIFVDDLVEVCVKMMSYQGDERIFNIGSGKGVTLNEILTVIRMLTRKEIHVIYKEKRMQDVKSNILDISKIKCEMDWYPATSLYDGIQCMSKAWDSQREQFGF
ncbi:NAD-dependent epimerase/dehydratase family protein [Centipeda periodontii]|nr:NAD-dependent epimerase/dehydratase family protein [Centipeda periodontii]